jgi:hypothetical protein
MGHHSRPDSYRSSSNSRTPHSAVEGSNGPTESKLSRVVSLHRKNLPETKQLNWIMAGKKRAHNCYSSTQIMLGASSWLGLWLTGHRTLRENMSWASKELLKIGNSMFFAEFNSNRAESSSRDGPAGHGHPVVPRAPNVNSIPTSNVDGRGKPNKKPPTWGLSIPMYGKLWE